MKMGVSFETARIATESGHTVTRDGTMVVSFMGNKKSVLATDYNKNGAVVGTKIKYVDMSTIDRKFVDWIIYQR